ncbi:MAG: hypothetical protein AAGF24_09935 [Cyanobacteria bacterium P01_H01_bin.121]
MANFTSLIIGLTSATESELLEIKSNLERDIKLRHGMLAIVCGLLEALEKEVYVATPSQEVG